MAVNAYVWDSEPGGQIGPDAEKAAELRAGGCGRWFRLLLAG
ncbi:hypothetical protein [Actinomadura sp. 6K520]|nr:hypothetical protein [Actinomadura sp. 6K520]